MATNANDPSESIRPTTSNPVRQEMIDAIDDQKNDLRGAADYQLRPEADRSGRAGMAPMDNARAAEEAAGGSLGDDTRADAERAFEESRGDRGERDGR